MTLDDAVLMPVTSLKGVGAKTGEALQSLGIYSIYDLLFYFPYRYDELETLPLDQLNDGQKVMLKGIVLPLHTRTTLATAKAGSALSCELTMILSWSIFNQPWLSKQLEVGQEVAIYGKYDLRKQSLSAYKLVAAKNADNGMAPIIRSTATLSKKSCKA